MEEYTVVENPVADVQEQEEPASQEPAEQVEYTPRTYTQDEFDNEVRRRSEFIKRGTLEQARREFENDPHYVLGKRMATIEGNSSGKDPNESIQEAANRYLEAQANKLAEDPKALARALLNSQIPIPQNTQQPNDAQRIAGELKQYISAGVLPENFNIHQVQKDNPNFLSDCMTMGVGPALMKINSRATKTAQQSALPQSTRPGFNQSASPKDYSKMSDEEFMKNEQRMKEAYLRGEIPKI